MKRQGDFLGPAPRIHLKVSDKDIAEGIARNSNHCVIAEALKRARPNLTHVAVDIQTIRATDKKKKERYVWLTPRSVQGFIINVDQGNRKALKPFSFFCREGQVTVSGSERLKKYRKPINSKGIVKKPKAKLRPSGFTYASVPSRVGGRTPPRGVGQRRSFGLRGLSL